MNIIVYGMLWIGVCCSSALAQQSQTSPPKKPTKISLAEVKLSADEEKEIRALVEQLVFTEGPATNRPVRNPNIKTFDADFKEVPKSDEQKRQATRYNASQAAFRKLSDHQLNAFPILIEHLDDKRQSINFRNHYLNNSVGDACKWIIYYQLQDRPQNYSRYGHSRTGRDGQEHTQPYWEGTPFDDEGGVKQWLEKNKELSYPEMQIKCLQWLLDREKKIGVPDADSYFLNVLPLEIRILDRRLELGDDVRQELEKLQTALKARDASIVPRELLPE